VDLLESAQSLLAPMMGTLVAPQVTRDGPGAILLLVSALDVTLNELIVHELAFSEPNDQKVQAVLEKSIVGKVDYLAIRWSATWANREDIRLLSEVRNEIARHFPRPGRARHNYPDWYVALSSRKLLIRNKEELDFDLEQKLWSYPLLYGACEATAICVQSLLSSAIGHWPSMMQFIVVNFDFYKKLPQPSQVDA
jgi:hypothetical protein